MNKYFVQFYDADDHRLLGSDGSAIMNLKTVRGVLRRLEGYRITPRAVRYDIFLTGSNFYNEDLWRRVGGGFVADLRRGR